MSNSLEIAYTKIFESAFYIRCDSSNYGAVIYAALKEFQNGGGAWEGIARLGESGYFAEIIGEDLVVYPLSPVFTLLKSALIPLSSDLTIGAKVDITWRSPNGKTSVGSYVLR